jgi:drug/metabolite transporter superfamily protein YnfA
MLDPAARGRMGRVFIASGGVLLLVGVVFGSGVLPAAPSIRWLLGGALVAAGCIEVVLGLRFLQESS